MTFACISQHEMRLWYNNAKDKQAMLRILADMTCATKDEVKKVLGISKSVKVRKRPTKLNLERARELYDAGWNDTQIAKELNVRSATVSYWRKKNFLPSNIPPSEVNDERMKYYQMGLTDKEVGEAVGRSASVIWRWRQDNKLPSNGTQGGNRFQKKEGSKDG